MSDWQQTDIPCVICQKEHDHRSGDHVCVGNLQDEIERLRAALERIAAWYDGEEIASGELEQIIREALEGGND